MIHINLLPEEYRRKARTPLKLMLAVSLAVAVNASLAAWLGWMAFGIGTHVESEHQVLLTEDDGLRPQVAYHRALTAESGRHQARETTLAEITQSRVSWTRKLDEFVDVVNRNDERREHMTWFDDLHIKQGEDPRTGNAGTWRAKGHSGSANFSQIGNFLDELSVSSFMDDFHAPGDPEGSEAITNDELMPPVIWDFPLTVDLKSVEDRQEASPARDEARAAAAQTGGQR
jgi:Tfp pilus assembly protein PilN